MANTQLKYEGDEIVLEDADLSAAVTRLALGTLVVPGLHIAPPTPPAEPTADAPVTTGVVTPANVAYTQADQTALANAVMDLATVCNELIVDVGVLEEALDAQATLITTLLAELQTAGILASS